MPERPDPFEAARQAEADLRELARGYSEAGLGGLADSLPVGAPSRSGVPDACLVIDTDVGGDPDDAVALAIAARQVPQLALVLTTDEIGGQRARFARQLLDACGRRDVRVVAGPELPGRSRFCVSDLLDPATPAQSGEPATAVVDLASTVAGPIRWVGMGPMTNLAALLSAYPELTARLRVTQMGGALAYRDPDRGEHNIRRDVSAARAALGAVPGSWLVTSDVTFTPELEIAIDSELDQRWAAAQAPGWANLLHAHFASWTAHSGHAGSMAHDPLTLAVALGLPFVEVDLDRVAFDDVGRMRLDPGGSEVWYSHTADYPAVNRWLRQQLDPVAWPNEAPPAPDDPAQ